MYDYVIVTHIPAFYKVNLYNELNKSLKIFVIFISSNTNEKRSNDFITLNKADFEYKVLYDGYFQNRHVKKSIFLLKTILKTIRYKKILLSGWDLKEFWYLIFTNSKSKNCLALESTINESKVDGLKGIIKKIFLSRISTVFASGKLHVELLKALKYKDMIKITKGVGIINRPKYKIINREYNRNFLFVGRLSIEKNIKSIVMIFNELPSYQLTLIGIGPLEKELKIMAKSNIVFLGQINNFDLKNHFLNNDILILPSISEPWGLVVEEALYFGMPVIVSENCGASELIINEVNGFILIENNLKEIISNINKDKYKRIIQTISSESISNANKHQVLSYAIN